MRSISMRLAEMEKVKINIGYVGENEHTTVLIDCKKAFDEYPEAVASLTVRPPRGGEYPAVVVRNGNVVEWTVTDSDLIYAGNGEIQLTFTVGEVIVKTAIGTTVINRSLMRPGDIPTPIQNWIEQANQKIAAAEEATREAKAAAEHQPIIDDNGNWNTWDDDEGAYVDTGIKAQGEDGAPGRDGQDGQDGQDGKDGKDGQDGAPGQDGTDATPDLITVPYEDLTFPVAAGTQCYHDGKLYQANQAIQTSEQWTAAHWTETTVEAQLSTVKSALTSIENELHTGETHTYTGEIAVIDGQTAGASIGITPGSGVGAIYHTKKNLFNLFDRTKGIITSSTASSPKNFVYNEYYNGFITNGENSGDGYSVLTYITDGIQVDKGTSGGGDGKGTIFPIQLKPGKYTLSGSCFGQIHILHYDSNNVYVTNEQAAQNTIESVPFAYTFTVADGENWTGILFRNANTKNRQYKNIMLVEGESAETYEECSFEKLANSISSITAYAGKNKIWSDAGSFSISGEVSVLEVMDERLDGLDKKTEPLENDVINRNLDVLQAVKACVGYGMNSGGVQNAKQTWGMLITTDVHAREQVMQNSIDYFNKYPFLHVGMCLGDMAASDYAETDGTWYTGRVNQSTKPWYTVLGNHEGGNSTDGSISATVADQFTKWIAPTLETMGMPSLAVPYYAVHNSTYGVSAIFLDCYDVPDTKSGSDFVVSRGTSAYSQAQIDWFINELNNVPAGNHLLIFQHGYTGASANDSCAWNQAWNTIIDISSYGELIPDIVNAWVTGGTLSDTYTTTVTGLSSITVSADFTSRGTGVFAGYIVGHYHRDLIAHSTKYTYQKIVALTCTADGNWQGGANDTPRVENEKSQDAFTIISVNKDRKTINLTRVGANWTVSMTQRIGYAVSYDNS